MNRIFRILAGALLAVGLACAQSPVRIVGSNGVEVVVGPQGNRYNSALTALTTSAVAFTSSTLKVQVIHCKSNSSTATTITIKDGNDVVYYDTVALAANSVFIAQYGPVGMTFTNGIKLLAAANTTISCQVEGVTQ